MANLNRIRKGDIVETRDRDFPPNLLPSTRPQHTDKNDDLLVTLSDAYENRRARQVGEWERLYGDNVYRAL